MQEGLEMFRATGVELGRTGYLCSLAEALLEAESLDLALSALTESQTAADQRGERECEAEILRLQGELLLKRDPNEAGEVQDCFERAIEIARKQSAKSWELRATISLARLFVSQGRREEACTRLAEIYNWFTEGFDTADLIDAKALLDQLSAESTRSA
jgi:predicted ATPase